MAVYKKLLEIQAAVKGLAKDKKAFNYEYVTGDKVLGFIRPLMSEKGLLLLPSVTEVKTEVVQYDAYDKIAKGIISKTEILYVVSMNMTWVDSTDGETVTEAWAGSGMNAFDKGYGSALTYGERYYLLKTFHIPTDKDDVDAVSTERDEALEKGYVAQVQQVPPAAPAQQQGAPVPEKQKKRILIGGKAWHSAVEKHARGEDMTEAMEERFILTQSDWDEFFAAVNAYKRENNIE